MSMTGLRVSQWCLRVSDEIDAKNNRLGYKLRERVK